MISRRILFLTSILATAVSFFTLGVVAFRSEAGTRVGDKSRSAETTSRPTEARPISLGREEVPAVMTSGRAKLVAEIKDELQREMGLLPLQVLRDRRSSFV